MDIPKILLVDDMWDALRYRKARLEHAGFAVTAADSGLGALRMARSERPDVVVTDIRMAGMDGYELCRQVRELYDVPVILYSAYDISQEHRDAAELVGAAVVMTSVCQIDELVQTIRSLLHEKTQMVHPDAAGILSALPCPTDSSAGQAHS